MSNIQPILDFIDSLGLGNTTERIKNEIQKHGNVIMIENVDERIKQLKEVDEKLLRALDKIPNLKGVYNETLTQLGILQGKILLRKLVKVDCDETASKKVEEIEEIVKNLLIAFNQKIDLANKIIGENLDIGPQVELTGQEAATEVTTNKYIGNMNDDIYRDKYLKYKMKYLQVK